MRLISNWKEVAVKSHSMWSQFLGLGALITPEVLWYWWQLDTNPLLWFFGGLALIVYGMIGRLVAQGIDHSKTQSPIPVVLLAAAIAVGGIYFTGERPKTNVTVPSVAEAAGDTFMEVAFPLISRWEGRELTAYLDRIASPPVWTVCYGETKGVKQGDTYTEAQCSAMLEKRISEFRWGMRRNYTEATVRLRLPATREAAYTSLGYNVGLGAAGKSTAVKRLNAGDVRGGCEAIGWWNKAGGRVVRGLVNRRADETRLCLMGVG